jgi:4-amino-4-deoxy-L-arabinose transferase-like glycosyltransferase
MNRTAPATAQTRITVGSLLLVAAYGLVLLLLGLGSTRVLTRHEVLAAQPAREMLRDGNWIIPTFAGEPRLVKPPATSWTIAAFMSLCRCEDEFFVRLPAALAGAASGVLLAMLTALWFGDRIGLIAGLAQQTAYYIQMQARLAEADMLMTVCVIGALTCFAHACVADAKPSKIVAILFYLLAGLAFLYKGGIVFIGLTVTCYLLWQRDRRALRFLRSPIGIILLLVLLLAWPVAAMIKFPPIADVWSREVFGRAAGNMGRSDPWHFYIWTVPWIILPWTPFTVVGVFEMTNRGFFRRPGGRFLICWFVPGLLLLSLSAWKHKHYIIPALPALTVPAALGLMVAARRFAELAKRRIVWLGLILFSIGIVAILATMKWAPVAAFEISTTIGVLLAGTFTVLYFAHRNSVNGQLITTFTTMGAVALSANILVAPHFDLYRVSANLARLANRLAEPGETIYLLGLGEAHAAYYLRFPIQRIDIARIPPHVDAFLALSHPRVAEKLSETGRVEFLSPTAALVAPPEHHREALVLFRWRRGSS